MRRFITRSEQHGRDQRDSAENGPVARPVTDLIASIERSAEHFRDLDLPKWKYRQIIREGKHSADKALVDAFTNNR